RCADLHVLRRIDAQLLAAALDSHHRDHDLVADRDFVAGLARHDEHQAFAFSRSNALCSVRTASSRYLSWITTEILISEVEIIWMLMPSDASALNILLAMPACERMPTPTSDTLQMSLAVRTPLAPRSLATRLMTSCARSKSLRCTVKVK